MAERGGLLVLCNIHGSPAKELAIARLDQVLNVEADVEDAIGLLRRESKGGRP